MYILVKGGSESYLGTTLRLTWNGRWGDRRTRRKGYDVTLAEGCQVSNSL